MGRVRNGVGRRWHAARASVGRLRNWRARSGVCPPIGTAPGQRLRRRLRGALGVDVHLVPPPGVVRVTKSTMQFEVDDSFAGLVADAFERSRSGPVVTEGEAGLRQRSRLFNFVRLVELSRGAPGDVVECGCYRGATAYLICRVVGAEAEDFKGEGLHLFDSFQGLSAISDEDQLAAGVPKGKTKRSAGMFAASVEDVQQTLREYPNVSFHAGWIPATLAGAPPGPFRFVHLDLDLHDPTLVCLDYFFPRLAPGGVLVCDDDGAVRWPGVRAAVDEFCARTGVAPLRLSTGQAVLLKAGAASAP